MIPEAFLICAMAMASPMHSFGPSGPIVATPPLSSLLRISGHILHVQNGKSYIEGIGYAYAQKTAFPFRRDTFQLVIWETLPGDHKFTFVEVWTNWLTEAIRITMSGGFLVFNEGHYVRWGKILQAFNWERLPFLYDGNVIYQKPVQPIPRQIRSAA